MSQLKQKITLFSAVMIVVSAMIGSGVFKKIAPMSLHLENVNWVLIAWLVAGSITLIGSLCNAEVSSMFPKAGGQYVYFKAMYGNFFAFLYGWSSFTVIQTATAASVAFVFAESLYSLFPFNFLPSSIESITLFSISDYMFQPFANSEVKLITIILISFLSFLNYCGVENGKNIGNILGTTVIIGIFIIIIFAFWGPQKTNIVSSNITLKEISITSFFAAMMAAFWAYEGWNNVGFMSGEIINPQKNVPKALMFGSLIVISIYLLVNYAFFQIQNIDFYKNLPNGSVAAIASLSSVWKWGGILISILILMSTFNSSNNTIMSAPRIYFAMAQDNLFPKSMAQIHSKFKTPHKAIIFQYLWCLVLIISGSFDILTEMLVLVAFIFYGCGAFGLIILRKKMPNIERSFKVPFYPILPIAFSLFSLTLVVLTFIDSPISSSVGIGMVFLGLFFYKWNFKK